MRNNQYPWIKYPLLGVCGLSCRLCPRRHAGGESPCEGCKSEYRMSAGCPLINCAVKKKDVEFCWECDSSTDCERWSKHLAYGRQHDSFKCYQTQERDVSAIQDGGVAKFETEQIEREQLLDEMLRGFNDGRSKSYFCIAATVMETDELKQALVEAGRESRELDIKGKARALCKVLDEIASKNGYQLKLRK